MALKIHCGLVLSGAFYSLKLVKITREHPIQLKDDFESSILDQYIIYVKDSKSETKKS